MQQGLRELGYVEGQNVILEYRFAEENVARLPALAADLVRRHVDIIVAAGHPMVLAAKQATTTIPIVMMVPTDPVETGLVESLARPGGNMTGLTNLVVEIAGKPLDKNQRLDGRRIKRVRCKEKNKSFQILLL